MELPRVIQIGYGVIREAGSFLAKFSPKRILIISGPIVWARVGEVVEEALKKEEYEYCCVEVDDSTNKEVEDAVTVAKEFGADLIIGLGGGRAVDVAKLTSFNCGVSFVS